MKQTKHTTYERALSFICYVIFFLFALFMKTDLSAVDFDNMPDWLTPQTLTSGKLIQFTPPGVYSVLVLKGNVGEVATVNIGVSKLEFILTKEQVRAGASSSADVYLGEFELSATTNIATAFTIKMALSSSENVNTAIAKGADLNRYQAIHTADRSDSLVLKIQSDKTADGAIAETEMKYGDNIMHIQTNTTGLSHTRTVSLYVKGGELAKSNPGEYNVIVRLEVNI